MIHKFEKEQFLDWLKIDISSISWGNKYREQFVSFWNHVFDEQKQIHEHFSKINYFIQICEDGPLKSWLIWICDSYLVYLFTRYNLNLIELSKISNRSLTHLAFIMRDFFISNLAMDSDLINKTFSIISPQDQNAILSCQDIFKGLNSKDLIPKVSRHNLISLEITLLKNWDLIFEDIPSLKKSKHKKNHQISIPKQLNFFQELIALFIVGGFLILTVKYANIWYENYLTKQVSLFNNQFKWLDKDKIFESKKLKDTKIELSYREIDQIEKKEIDFNINDEASTIRYEDESDVTVTSVKSIPQNFETAKAEQSSYEEKKKGGFRDLQYGRKRAYRIMLTSVKPEELKEKLDIILKNYHASKVDNVAPGKNIPGGVYFNLYIPRDEMKKFLSKMDEFSEATILESKTIFSGPENMDKVFIWIKRV